MLIAIRFQAVNNCFLYRMPLARLALVVRCLPAVRDNLLADFFTSASISPNGARGSGGIRHSEPAAV